MFLRFPYFFQLFPKTIIIEALAAFATASLTEEKKKCKFSYLCRTDLAFNI